MYLKQSYPDTNLIEYLVSIHEYKPLGAVWLIRYCSPQALGYTPSSLF